MIKKIFIYIFFIAFTGAFLVDAAENKDTVKKIDTKKEVKERKHSIFLMYNPHLAMFKDNKIDEEACLLCHNVKPNTDPGLAGNEAYLNDKIDNICSNCHGLRPHVGAIEHLKKVPIAMLKRIESYEKKYKEPLKLNDGRVTCKTCHNPHPAGMLKTLDGEKYKDVKEYFDSYKMGGKTESAIYEENIKRFKREKLFVKTLKAPENSLKLPFWNNFKKGRACMICHDIYGK